MKMSKVFSKTLREAPNSAESVGYGYLLRSGFIQQMGTGIFSLLPFGLKSTRKIENIIREEMNEIGGQEFLLPVVQPADIWKETGRYFSIDKEMTKFKDRADRDMALAMTCEEATTDVARHQIDSYKKLPQLVYQIQTKWRDDPRPRAGLIRVREFTMKDSYSFDKDIDGLIEQYKNHYTAYYKIYSRCSLPVISVKSDSGMMGGKVAHEYMYLHPVGEDTIITCDTCDYTANRQVAKFKKVHESNEDLKDLKLVETPNAKTIEELAQLLKIDAKKTAKALFVMATFVNEKTAEEENKLVVGMIRGDLDIEENKLQNAIKANALRPAVEEEIIACNIVPGYGSPIKAKNCIVVVDDSISKATNLVCGANKVGFHYLNSNFNKDYKGKVADIASAKEGYSCTCCNGHLKANKGIEVGNIFQLGTRYSEAMGAMYQDENGKRKPVVMGSYGIGIGRLLACLAEQYSDDRGLNLPISVAPFEVHLVSLIKDKEASEKIYNDIKNSGIDILFDERKESPGVKFADADLIGAPIRITLGNRTFKEGQVEVKFRSNLNESHLVDIDNIVPWLTNELNKLRKEISDKIIVKTLED